MSLPVANIFSGKKTSLIWLLMSVLMVVIILLYCSSVRHSSEIDVWLQLYLPVLVDIKAVPKI